MRTLNTLERAVVAPRTETLRALQDGDRIVLRYTDNPNGSVDDIAGVGRKRSRWPGSR